MPHADTEAMNLHLAEIGNAVTAGSPAALILDGASWHVNSKLLVSDNISLVKLPPYAPDLNLIENVWAYLRGTKLPYRLFDSYDDIVIIC